MYTKKISWQGSYQLHEISETVQHLRSKQENLFKESNNGINATIHLPSMRNSGKFHRKKNSKFFHDLKDEAHKMTEIYLKCLNTIFFKLRKPI